jgi:hypothetical protein
MSIFRTFRKLRAINGGEPPPEVRWGKSIPSIILYLIIGIWIVFSCFYIVEADEQGVVKRFGDLR